MIFTRLNKASRPSSALAMALVLAATGALGVTALEQPAHAQKKKEKDQEEAAPELSNEFRTAYQPIAQLVSGETPDHAAATPLVPALLAVTNTPDEKNAAGRLLLAVANGAGDDAMRLQAMELILDSGKGDAGLNGQIQFALYQAYSEQNDIAKARTALEGAIASNYTFDATMSDGSVRKIGAPQMQRMIADLYFNSGQNSEGLAYLSSAIDGWRAAGDGVPESLIRSALAEAYGNNLGADSAKYVAMLAEYYPTPSTWGDAIIITLNAADYPNADALDLLRLSRRLNVYNDTRILSEYVELLDSRRFPGEVVAAIDEGFALSNIDKTDPFLIEARRDASGRVDTDRRELAGLATEARAAGADLKTLVVAGDTFLSYDRPADAEEFYARALGMSGVDTPVVLTRLGIAQYDQGKYAEAMETFGKIEGARSQIANLWAIYAAQQMAPAAVAETAAGTEM